MKISLKKEMETLLIPLYGRAMMSKKGFFIDKDAEDAIAKLDYDFSRLKILEKTQIMLSLRGALIDNYTKDFLKSNPGSTVIYLGCGLDARAKRLSFPSQLWYDLDYPEVIEIKKKLYKETAFYRYIPSSVTDYSWMKSVEAKGEPVLVIAEGLLMYLSEQEVKDLTIRLRDRFKTVYFIFDAFSRTTAKFSKGHPSLSKTGATIFWGADSPKEIEAFGEGIIHLKTFYLTDERILDRLPTAQRLMFRIAGVFKAAKEAHRIFVMKLNT